MAVGLGGLSLALAMSGSLTGEAFALGSDQSGPHPLAAGAVSAPQSDQNAAHHHAKGAARAAEANKVGDYVWYDQDGDGFQGPGEMPAPGVTADLVNTQTGTVVQSTVTDGAGKYSFQGFDNGTYKVCFGKPEGYQWTKANAGGMGGNDSSVDPGTGCSYPVAVEDCEELTLDAGLVPLNKLGDRVWSDQDGDGIQDPGEPGVKGVKVTLVDPKTGKTIGTTWTDENGYYLFTNLPDGKYRVCFERPKGSLWTKQNAGGDGDDSVVYPNGCSPVVTLGPGMRDNRTVDAGLVDALRLTVIKTDKKTYKPLAGAVFQLWKETNGKPGLQRKGPWKDKFVKDCVTNWKGRCSFGKLKAGTYYLVETDVPEGYMLPKWPVTGPYHLTSANACEGDGHVVRIHNKRGEHCKGKKCWPTPR